MSEELHHEEVRYEREDLNPKAIFAFLIGLAVFGLLLHFILFGMYRFMDSYSRTHQPQANPLVTRAQTDRRQVSPDEIKQFPQPRLEINEREEIKDFRLKEEETLNSYGWVDQKSGVIHIPIERAMELIAQRGLPTTPKAGMIPPSEVNVVNQAAQRADTSGSKGKQK